MVFYNEYLQPVREISRLGFPSTQPEYIPESYLEQKQFIIWRTCHSYGDWQIISAMPRLLKEKYPDCTIAIPSPTCLATKYSPDNWKDKHVNPFNNVIEVYSNNPHVDGMLDDLPDGMPVYHDHFRIYDLNNLNIPLTEQMLKFWRFDPTTVTDSAPELYWSDEEKKQGDDAIRSVFGNDPFAFLYVDDWYFELHEEQRIPRMAVKRQLIQSKIDEFKHLPWLYYAGKDISETPYKISTRTVNIKSLGVTLRVQSYIKTKCKVVVGHQGGYGTECISRYTEVHAVPLHAPQINEHFVRTVKYIYP